MKSGHPEVIRSHLNRRRYQVRGPDTGFREIDPPSSPSVYQRTKASEIVIWHYAGVELAEQNQTLSSSQWSSEYFIRNTNSLTFSYAADTINS